jgi:hypothetical protein
VRGLTELERRELLDAQIESERVVIVTDDEDVAQQNLARDGRIKIINMRTMPDSDNPGWDCHLWETEITNAGRLALKLDTIFRS